MMKKSLIFLVLLSFFGCKEEDQTDCESTIAGIKSQIKGQKIETVRVDVEGLIIGPYNFDIVGSYLRLISDLNQLPALSSDVYFNLCEVNHFQVIENGDESILNVYF